eukprot:5531896-Amphidinium_carterae.1
MSSSVDDESQAAARNLIKARGQKCKCCGIADTAEDPVLKCPPYKWAYESNNKTGGDMCFYCSRTYGNVTMCTVSSIRRSRSLCPLLAKTPSSLMTSLPNANCVWTQWWLLASTSTCGWIFKIKLWSFRSARSLSWKKHQMKCTSWATTVTTLPSTETLAPMGRGTVSRSCRGRPNLA